MNDNIDLLPKMSVENAIRLFEVTPDRIYSPAVALAHAACRELAKEAVRSITISSAVWGEPYDEKGVEMASLPWKQVFVDMQRMPDLMLVRVPKISIVAMGQLVKQRSDIGYRLIWDKILREFGTQVEEPRWVLMTRDVLAGSRNRPYAEQQEMAKSFKSYDVPSLREAIACIFARLLQDGTRLYSDSPWTYTRCQENLNGFQTVVGGFAPTGLFVSDNFYFFDNNKISVAAMRKF
ncbi:MAG: hypothetical protein KDK48_06480 [Chlamydiia bacterium]|nr:hypothetical protein [Chlamydiia bacterium]